MLMGGLGQTSLNMFGEGILDITFGSIPEQRFSYPKFFRHTYLLSATTQQHSCFKQCAYLSRNILRMLVFTLTFRFLVWIRG